MSDPLTDAANAIDKASPKIKAFAQLAAQRIEALEGGTPPPPPGSGLFAGPMYAPVPANPSVEIAAGQGALSKFTTFGMNGLYYAKAIFDSRGKNWPTRTVTNGTWTMEGVPLPDQLSAYLAQMGTTDTERHLVVVGTDHVWSVYGTTTVDATTWHCRSMGCMRAPGVSHGWWRNDLGPYVGPVSGACDGIGVVTRAELDAGLIGHALVCITGSVNNASSFRKPATESDGQGGAYDRTKNIEIGSLLQLDPALDLASLNPPTKDHATIARALQEFGCYSIDSSSNGAVTILGECWNNGSRVNTDPGWQSWATAKLLPHLRLIAASSAPCSGPALVYDDHTVFGQPHK